MRVQFVSTVAIIPPNPANVSALGLLTTLLEVAALVVIWVLFARSHRDARAVSAASAASVLAFVAFGRVLSPQYVIWLVPALAVVARRWSLVLLGLAVGLTQVWSQGRYHDVTAGRPIVWAVLARDLVLVGLYVLAVATVARRARRCHGKWSTLSRRLPYRYARLSAPRPFRLR